MTNYNYNINSRKVATKLIILGIISALEACSTTVNFTDGIIIGETAQREYNKRQALKKYQVETLDRESLQNFLDKEV